MQFYRNFLSPQFVSDVQCGQHGEDPVKKTIHSFFLSVYICWDLPCAWYFCYYWGYNSEPSRVLALLRLGAQERQTKSQSDLVISLYVSREKEGCSYGGCSFRGWHLRPERWGSESGGCLESAPKWGYSKHEGLTWGWLGLLQHRQGGHCGQRRQEHGRRCSRLFGGLPGQGEGIAPETGASTGVWTVEHWPETWQLRITKAGSWGDHWETFTVIRAKWRRLERGGSSRGCDKLNSGYILKVSVNQSCWWSR